jgi:hypothetical protein
MGSRKAKFGLRILALSCLFSSFSACGDRRIVPPVLDAEEAAGKALAEFDLNKDSFLDAAELERCPGLKCCIKELDKDSDGRLNADEISERLSKFRGSGVGLLGVSCTLVRNDAPFPGPTVTLVPEKFLQPALKASSGVADDRGQVTLQIEDQPVPGVALGFYRIEVSYKDAEGKETIPARYNSETILGHEVTPFARGGTGITIHLKF